MLQYDDRVVPLQVLLYRVDQAGRVGVCGNGVCEVGELVAVSEDGTVSAGCVQDCRLPVLACPLDAEGTSCAGAPSSSHLALPSTCRYASSPESPVKTLMILVALKFD